MTRTMMTRGRLDPGTTRHLEGEDTTVLTGTNHHHGDEDTTVRQTTSRLLDVGDTTARRGTTHHPGIHLRARNAVTTVPRTTTHHPVADRGTTPGTIHHRGERGTIHPRTTRLRGGRRGTTPPRTTRRRGGGRDVIPTKTYPLLEDAQLKTTISHLPVDDKRSRQRSKRNPPVIFLHPGGKAR